MASRKELQRRRHTLMAYIRGVDDVELYLGPSAIADSVQLDRLTYKAELSQINLTLFSARNIEGDEI